MSAKWRALQHRHRYTYSALAFTPSYTSSLALSPLQSNPLSLQFSADLSHIISLNSLHSQLTHAKSLASSFTSLLLNDAAPPSLLQTACRFYLHIIFIGHSQPLHRTLLSALSKITSNKERQALLRDVFNEFFENKGSYDFSKFCLSRAALSVLGMPPKLQFLIDVVGEFAGCVAWDIVSELESVVLDVNEWARPSPDVMEQCQESLSCMYYLVQRFPDKFQDSNTGGDGNVMVRVFAVLLGILKSVAFSRDCLVAAGVSLCAALQTCINADELGLLIIRGIFDEKPVFCSDIEFANVVSKIPFNGNLCFEIGSFSVLSRLCLIRGILTAVSRSVLTAHFVVSRDELTGNEGHGVCSGARDVKTILYNGILPELCNYCENPTDGHFNFHVLTVLQICLQQIKTSLLSNGTEFSDDYNPIPIEMVTRILRIIWNNLEDPLSQTVKQVHLIFDLFIDIQSSLCCGEGSEPIKLFLQKIASDLLRLGHRCKGRYIPLSLLTKRLGAKAMLDMSPNLLYETIHAYMDDDVCCAATTFLKCFLEYLRDECWDSDGIEVGYGVYREHCLQPLLYGLASGVSKLRSNLNTYALPILLEIDEESIFPMLSFISIVPHDEGNGISYPELSCPNVDLGVEQKVAVLVSLLKVCRSRALIEGDIDFCDAPVDFQTSAKSGTDVMTLYASVCIKGVAVKVHVEWLVLALTHADEMLRVDAAESLFLNPKTSTIPSHLELTLLKEAVPLNMRSCSTSFQMKWASLFRKFFSRVRTALERQFKQGCWQPLLSCDSNGSHTPNRVEEAVTKRAKNLLNFMRWLSSFLFFSCYPSAPYRRKIMAMELILIMLNVWPIVPSSQSDSGTISAESYLIPYSKGITWPDSTLLLVGSIVDSWDRLRESSFRILLSFPTPLPGILSVDMVQKVVTWAKKLVCSPRVRESDAGALTLRLIFRKYVLELGWLLRASAVVSCFKSDIKLVNGESHRVTSNPHVVEYIKSLIDWLNAVVEEGERDLSEACKSSFVHGVLLTLRYTFEELDWSSEAVVSNISDMRLVLEKLLELVMRITSIALWVVSSDALHLPGMEEMIDDDNTYLMDDVGVVRPSEDDSSNSQRALENKSSEQIVMVGCWLAMKELSLLLGTIIRKIPLPSNSCSDLLEQGGPSLDAANALAPTLPIPVLDLKQLEQIGDHFLEVLLKMKHNGAIDKTRAGFTALCNRLLCSNDPRLCRLTESWMEQLMERTVAKGQVVDDLLRRSAGIPASFIALFLSEPEGAPKRLLPRALRWLIDVVNSSLLNPAAVQSTYSGSCGFPAVNSEQETDFVQSFEMNVLETSKIRDEGVVPTVHAFNALRAAFNDTNLATDTSGFAAEALIISIRAFSSPYWEVRNSACQAYTALVRRMIGFLNVQKRESGRRALTGLEFFHRYPPLHPFLYSELKVATDLLGDGALGDSEANLAKVVHPSLCPMLIFLSRLKPSAVASESGDDLDPFLLMPFIRSCSTQSNMRVRILASRALTGLVSNEKLPNVLLNIAFDLPCKSNQIVAAPFSPTSLKPNHHSSYNSIHGVLLQLCSLLDVNCRNLADFAKKEKILSDLLQVLATRSWIAKPGICPCPILNASFIRVLDLMLSIASAGYKSEIFFAIRSILVELSMACLDVEESYGLSYYDPTIAELREQATISYFICVLHTSTEGAGNVLQMQQSHTPLNSKLLEIPEAKNDFLGLPERLVSSLLDSSYEVRLATLKWLLKFLKSAECKSETHHLSSNEIRTIQHWTRSNLQETMVKLLDSESNHRCKCYILRILFIWNSLQFQEVDKKHPNIIFVGTLDFDLIVQFWGKLTSLYKSTRHTKTQEILICCMAICVRRYLDLLNSSLLACDEAKETGATTDSCLLKRSTYLYECIAFFVNLIKEHSNSSEPVMMRKAAAESIIASGMLEQADVVGSSICSQKIPTEIPVSDFEPKEAFNMYACQVLEMWFTCIKLLEDEDDGIRQWLAINVVKCFSTKRSTSSFEVGCVPTQVEKVIESSFGYLSSIFGHWIYYFDSLSQWVLNEANCVVHKADLVMRVFDKEIDNHHEEKLLICQICCYHLERLLISKSCSHMPMKQLMDYLYNWRRRFCDQLTLFAKDHVEKFGGVEWIGGVGNHKDAFLPVYANLLGFYALSNFILSCQVEDDAPLLLLPDVLELGKIIEPFFSNPLIANLYHSIEKLHQKRVGGTSEHRFMDGSVWDGFDPYFLLQ